MHDQQDFIMMNSEEPTNGSTPASPESGRTMTADEKVSTDLATLEQQVDACRALLSAPDMKKAEDVDDNEVLLAYVGFLEACVPRMEQLIETALSTGALGEGTVEKIFIMNDRLNKTLDDCDHPSTVTDTAPAPTGTASASGSASASASAAAPADDANFDPFGIAESNTSAAPAEVDPFASPAPQQQPPGASASDDPFDLLAKERAE
mmetsp:Transcript_27295/g.55045  ORF Transcript_27295/g.55045 Transcript_27295/m.55045 type:complete len:207 (-) Transcript_27295:4922-5542(-)